MRRRYYDGDDTTGGGGGDDTTAGAGGDDTLVGAGAGDGKTFSQADLDRIVAARNRKANEENRALLERLEKMEGTVGDNESLKQEVERLKKRTLTQEELEREAREKAQKELSSKVTDAEAARDRWRAQFENQHLLGQLQTAMVLNDVDPPMLAVAETYFRGMSEITYDSDGRPAVTVKMPSVDAEKKPITLELTPSEAIKHLKESGLMPNLFKGGVRPGAGGSGARDTGKTDAMSLTMEEYAKLPPEQRHG